MDLKILSNLMCLTFNFISNFYFNQYLSENLIILPIISSYEFIFLS